MNIIEKCVKNIKQKTFFTHLIRHIFFTRRFYKIFNFFIPFIKIKQNKIFFDNFIGSGYGGNPKYIAELLHIKHSECELVFVYDKEKCTPVMFPSFVKTVPIYSLAHLMALASSKVWIIDYRPLVHIRKRKNQFYIQTWHATIGTKKSEKDAENTLPKTYIKNAIADSKQIDVCIAGSEQMFDFHRRAFWYDGEILKSGCPHSDILFNATQQTEIKKQLGFANKKICMYAPTFRNSKSIDIYNLDYDRLKKNLEKLFSGDWIILLRLHPNISDVDISTFPNFVFNLSKYNDVQELLCASDILITDYSSIIYDFMLTERPGFIFATDFNDYEKERGFLIDLKNTPFPIAETNEELEKKLSEFDFNSYLQKVEKFKNMIGTFEDGHASERVAKWMEEKVKI